MLLEGIEAADLIKGPLGEVMPRKIAITPTAGGISKKALVALAQRGIDGKIVGDAAWQAAFLKLLAENPVTLGFEDLAVDFGVAKLEGGGELEITSPSEITARAEFHVTGLDALIRRANAAPELKQVAPVLIFLKGIGEQDGKDTVWRIAYEDGKTTINDTDLSDIMPGKDAGPGPVKKKR